MPDVKEKLIEVLCKKLSRSSAGYLADHLIANGVTILESNLKVLESATDTNVGHTKADRIRAMSDEELAEGLEEWQDWGGGLSKETWLEWLQQPAEVVHHE